MKKTLFLIVFTAVCGVSAFAQYPTNGLVVYYPLKSNASDSSGNGYHATANNISYVTGRNGGSDSAFYFNNSGVSYNITNTSLFHSQSYTMAAWVNVNSVPNTYGNFIELGTATFFRVIKTGSTNFRLEYGYRYGTSSYRIFSSYIIDEKFYDTWHHLAIVRSGPTNEIQVYLNGELKETNSSIDLITYNSSDDKLNIGYRFGNSILNFRGAISDAFYYDRALTQAEIQQLYEHNSTFSALTVTASLPDTTNVCTYDTTQIGIGVNNAIKYFWTLNNLKVEIYYTNNFENYQSANLSFYTDSNNAISFQDKILKCFIIGTGKAIEETTILNISDSLGDFTVNQDGLRLWVNAVANATYYQWYKDAAPITGANDTSYTATQSGDYYLLVANSGCSKLSETSTVVVSGIEEIEKAVLLVYPNPANNQVTIENIEIGSKLSIIDITGKTHYTNTVNKSNANINLSNFNNGLYFLHVESIGNVSNIKLLINR